ncbi:VanW family protein [Paenibacillus sp. sgz302251]|uniref:VanW family protein n=1 Tax=Paenibacillus sp. sgz302251 TaxID=3414493 RepID=UPI003C7A1767
MGFQWLLAILLLFQQAELPASLIVEHQGNPIVKMNRTDFMYRLSGIPLIDHEALYQQMEDLDKRVKKAPVNATLDGAGRIISEQEGSKLDRLKFEERFYSFIFEGGFSRLEAPMQTTYPKVDSELLSMIKVKRIGQYVTYYNSHNKNRSYNISLAALAINNYVVFPGEIFSFNKIVGKRTKEKGYLRAPVIVRGEVSEDIGGGICQISSTLFNAVDRAGLQIIERYSHSRNVPYVPSGRDATVSWYGPDFVFQNKYNQPILIRAYANAGQVIIMICSSEMVNDKQRNVPSASKKLPAEIKAEINANQLEP